MPELRLAKDVQSDAAKNDDDDMSVKMYFTQCGG